MATATEHPTIATRAKRIINQPVSGSKQLLYERAATGRACRWKRKSPLASSITPPLPSPSLTLHNSRSHLRCVVTFGWKFYYTSAFATSISPSMKPADVLVRRARPSPSPTGDCSSYGLSISGDRSDVDGITMLTTTLDDAGRSPHIFADTYRSLRGGKDSSRRGR